MGSTFLNFPYLVTLAHKSATEYNGASWNSGVLFATNYSGTATVGTETHASERKITMHGATSSRLFSLPFLDYRTRVETYVHEDSYKYPMRLRESRYSLTPTYFRIEHAVCNSNASEKWYVRKTLGTCYMAQGYLYSLPSGSRCYCSIEHSRRAAASQLQSPFRTSVPSSASLRFARSQL